MLARALSIAILCSGLAVACGSGDDRGEQAEPASEVIDEQTGDEQTFEEAMRLFCEAPNLVEIPDDADPAERAYLLAKYIDERLENAEVRELFEALATMNADGRAEHVLEAAQRAGLNACPVVDPVVVAE